MTTFYARSPPNHHRYAGEVFFVPVTIWQAASWAVSRSMRRLAGDDAKQAASPQAFARAYSARSYAPCIRHAPP